VLPQLFRTAIDLAADAARTRAPKRAARMRVSVIGERMPARQYFGDEMRMLLRVRADDEERRARIELLEHVQDSAGVRR
jgi:hypothetical protein